MASTKSRIGIYPHSLGVLLAFSAGWQVLTFAFITILLPPSLLLVGMIGSVVGASFAIIAVLKGSMAYAQMSLLDAWIIFILLLISQAVAGTIGQFLSITVLQCVMVLFAVEVLTVSCRYRKQLSSEWTGASAWSELPLRRSAQQAARHVSRAGLLFASCYLASLGVLYAAPFTASAAPLLSDISVYIVVVSVSLALLILLRED